MGLFGKKCELCGEKVKDLYPLTDMTILFVPDRITFAGKSEEYRVELLRFFVSKGLYQSGEYCLDCLGNILDENGIEWR